MSKADRPYVALTPADELTIPMPLPAPPTREMQVKHPNAIPVLQPNAHTVRLTPPSLTAVKTIEHVEGVKSGELQTRAPGSGRTRRQTPYASILDPVEPRVLDEESVVIEQIYDAVPAIVPSEGESTDGTVQPLDMPTSEATVATPAATLDIEYRATVLYWLVNLAREQGLIRHRRARDEQDILILHRVMEQDPIVHDYTFDEDPSMPGEKRLFHVRARNENGKKRKLHSIELTVHDWPRFETWMKRQQEGRYRDMSTLDMLDGNVRVAAWTYLDEIAQRVHDKSASGHAMHKSGQPTMLLNL